MPEQQPPQSYGTESNQLSITAVVIDQDVVRILHLLSDVDGLALHGTAADDPETWDDIALLWPRYRWHDENTEFVDSLPCEEHTNEHAPMRVNEALEGARAWFAIDLHSKRVFSGGAFPIFRLRHQPPSTDPDGPPEQVTVLPPWWQLHQRCQPRTIWEPRDAPIQKSSPHREILWGRPLTDFLAVRLIDEIQQAQNDDQDWQADDWGGGKTLRHDLVVAVHRDWLMTPRDDLQGECPRDCLHRGPSWIDDVVSGQEFRVHQGEEPIPISIELTTYADAPMGSHEILMYFDACRDSILAAGQWLIRDPQRIRSDAAAGDERLAAQLGELMWEFLQDWLTLPFEGGRPAEEIIRCERLRIPLVARAEDHVVDCDCPICDMMASGMFGPSFCRFDGHSLEVDDEFAFSMCSTREEWELQQAEWEEMNARITANMKAEEAKKLAGSEDDAEEPESAWKTSSVSDEPIPGDPLGHLKLAFLLAEIVGCLQDENAPQSDIDAINDAFRNYRRDEPGDKDSQAGQFVAALEDLAQRHPSLISRSADLQSRVHELARSPRPSDDIPF